MAYLPHPTNNRLLNLLEATDEKSLLSHMQLIYLSEGETLFENGQKLAYAYFPVSAVISMIVEPVGMIAIESATIRNEGVFGVPLLRDDHLTTRANVQCEGYCYRVEVGLLQESINRSDAFVEILLKYLQLRMSKIAQMAICSRHHSVEQQLCRVLLNILDCLPDNTISITQHIIATKLNVRRESITFHVGNLSREGVINLKRGKIIVLDRSVLEKKCCECYQIIALETARLLPCSINHVSRLEVNKEPPEVFNNPLGA